MGNLKNDEWLLMLSKLAKIEIVKLIVSVDHIKAASLFSDQLLNNFNFYCVQVNTFEPYT